MDNIKITVEQVVIGKFDCDCIYTTIDDKPIQICFNKKDKISQYDGQDVLLAKYDVGYSLQPIVNKKLKNN